MNILILSPTDPTTLNHGAAIRIYNLAKRFASLGNNVTIICFLHYRRRHHHITTHEKNLTIIKTSLRQTIFSPNFFIKLILKSDIVQIEFHTLSPIIPFLRLLGKPIVLDEHGVEISFVREIHKALERRITLTHYLKTFLLEWLAVKFSSAVFVCSKLDGEKIQHIYKISEKKIAVTPNGVDENFFEDIEPYNYGKPAILFMGSFDHAPNISAAKFLLNHVIPELFMRNENVIFVFVGRNPPSWVTQNQFKGRVKVFANVKDVRPFVAGADVVVAPIFHGSGTRIKILEYMSLGKPVISTSKGAEGINVKDGQNILIRNSRQEFVLAILQLLDNTALAKRIGENARKLVKKEYMWRQIADNALEAYKMLERAPS